LFVFDESDKLVENFTFMSKSHDQKKEEKKKPQKSLKEKRAEKQAKKANRS